MHKRSFQLPRESGLGLKRITNAAGLDFSALPNGCIFALEHQHGQSRSMLNQVLGSPLGGGIVRLLLRTGGAKPSTVEAVGPSAKVDFGAGQDRFVWKGEGQGLRHCVTVWLHPSEALWLWRVDAENTGSAAQPCDTILVQDLGLGPRGFVMNNEAYASQYIDHTVPMHPRFGPVVMSRQNMAQDGRHPWTAHGCFDGAASFATDALQLFGPAYRDANEVALPFGTSLPGVRLQHECACAILQSGSRMLQPGESTAWTFFGVYDPAHAEPTSERDLSLAEAAEQAAKGFAKEDVPFQFRSEAFFRTHRRSFAAPQAQTLGLGSTKSGRMANCFPISLRTAPGTGTPSFARKTASSGAATEPSSEAARTFCRATTRSARPRGCTAFSPRN